MLIRIRDVVNVLPIATLILAGIAFSAPGTAHANTSACTVSGSSLIDAKQKFEQSCSGRVREDCDPSGGVWQCSTENLPLASGQSNQSTTPSTPAAGNAVLSIQAENASSTTGSGWSTESSLSGFNGSGYIVWRGSDDFRTTNSAPPAGIKAYDFTVAQAGTYEFTARVQARVGNGSAAGDKDNDAWMKFTSGSATSGIPGDASKWTKFFVGGNDESWKNYSNGEQYDPTFKTAIRRDLSVGTHRILVGGRSARFAIDSVGLNLLSASGVVVPVVPSTPVNEPATPTESTTTTTPTPTTTGSCSAQGATLAQARSNYAQNCPTLARQDCDPISGGAWVCSSANIGNATPAVNDTSTTTTTTTTTTTPTEPTESTEPANEPTEPQASGICSAQGSSLAQAKANYANSCPTIAREDCDPIGSGRWLCSSANIGNTTTSTTTGTTTNSTPSPPQSNDSTVGLISENDLLVLHYDNCPDRDDGHAIVAGKAVIDKVGLKNLIVVNGTCGASIRNLYQPSSVNVLQAVYGNNWLDGFNQEASSVITSADRWAATLANGDDVWVAEGGPSDFTAKVLQRIGSVYPSVNRKRIRVVQHSSGRGFNERFTSSAGISLVKQVADYRPIPDGNNSNNGTADFNQKSSYFVTVAGQSRYASEWDAAFDYLNPASKLDFSDTVEILYIISDTQTRTVDNFANNYLR